MTGPVLVILDGRTCRVDGVAADLIAALVEDAAHINSEPVGGVELRYTQSDVEMFWKTKRLRRRR